MIEILNFGPDLDRSIAVGQLYFTQQKVIVKFQPFLCLIGSAQFGQKDPVSPSYRLKSNQSSPEAHMFV